MTHLPVEQRHEVARRTEAMLALVDRYLAGETNRHTLLAWARDQGHAYSSPPPFAGHAEADALHTCLWNLDVRLPDGEPLVRDVDLAEQVRCVREGVTGAATESLTGVCHALTEVARRAGATRPAMRFAVDGLGWFEGVRFASRATGRIYYANAPVEGANAGAGASTTAACVDVVTASWAPTPEGYRTVLEDLFDALAIDLEDVRLYQPLEVPMRVWDLMRADDTGNAFLVGSFTGYAKAHARLRAFEARPHKQAYWLERRHSGTRTPP